MELFGITGLEILLTLDVDGKWVARDGSKNSITAEPNSIHSYATVSRRSERAAPTAIDTRANRAIKHYSEWLGPAQLGHPFNRSV